MLQRFAASEASERWGAGGLQSRPALVGQRLYTPGTSGRAGALRSAYMKGIDVLCPVLCDTCVLGVSVCRRLPAVCPCTRVREYTGCSGRCWLAVGTRVCVSARHRGRHVSGWTLSGAPPPGFVQQRWAYGKNCQAGTREANSAAGVETATSNLIATSSSGPHTDAAKGQARMHIGPSMDEVLVTPPLLPLRPDKRAIKLYHLTYKLRASLAHASDVLLKPGPLNHGAGKEKIRVSAQQNRAPATCTHHSCPASARFLQPGRMQTSLRLSSSCGVAGTPTSSK